MSDRLEDFVRQNREQFDMREPDPSLWLGIDLPGTAESAPETLPLEKASPGGRLTRWLRVAAAIALIFAGSSAGIWFLTGGNSSQDTPDADMLYGEILETEAYYTRMVANRYQELQPYLDDDPASAEMLRVDMEELDQAYEELKEDLKDNVANPAVIEAMILNYSVKLEILEDLLHQLKEKEEQDDEDVSFAL